jgi:hypothetical protein
LGTRVVGRVCLIESPREIDGAILVAQPVGPGLRAITDGRGFCRFDPPHRGPLDPSRLVARRGRSRGAGAGGASGPATYRGRSRAPEVVEPLSRPADRAPHRGRCNFPDAVRSPDPSRNRYSHSAVWGRTLRAAVGGFRTQRPGDPPAAPRHKAKTPPGGLIVTGGLS